ncbi:hypothetical protein BIW59_22240, partial [Salmonella enterica]|nr:hypothetical protein [Salmonella enterica]
PLAGLMMAGIPFMASAADTLDMKASLSESTCELITPSFTWNAGQYKPSTPSAYNQWHLYTSKEFIFSLRNCSATLANVVMTPSYTVSGGAANAVFNNGTAKNVLVLLKDDNGAGIASGTEYTTPIINGNADISINAEVRNRSGYAPTLGTLDFPISFTFEYS